ncbi:MAG: hypothetical protein HY784_16330 [Chloroflexi bacterium]|nr:hypothetical protein [Chloroflexota bacterium]
MSNLPEVESIVLYHGTDAASALDILNGGLNAKKLAARQGGRARQLGIGWYAASDLEVAWFFASLAPGASQGYTVIEMRLPQVELRELEERGLVVRGHIAGVPFDAEQYRFSPAAFEQLNSVAEFRPYHGSDL